MLLFALGRYSGVYPILAPLPGLNLFRFPTRYIVLFHLTLATLAAIALADLGGLIQRRETVAWSALRPLLVPVALCVVTVSAPISGDIWSGKRVGWITSRRWGTGWSASRWSAWSRLWSRWRRAASAGACWPWSR